jgi:transposase
MRSRYNPNAKKKQTFSGKRIKRGLYKSNDGTLLNADANGAYNILRKTDSGFSFSTLASKVGSKVKEWLHPTKRFRFFESSFHQNHSKQKVKESGTSVSPILDQQLNLL